MLSLARGRPPPAQPRAGLLEYLRNMPWDPSRDLLTMQERLESLFGRATPGWVPPVDLLEQPDHYVLTVELPGLNRADIHIEGSEDAIVVSGQRPAQPGSQGRYHQLERGQGPFSRSFRFGQPIDVERISAELADGVLTIVVPKARPAGLRIDIT
jgi:HSP20 family protein